MFPRVGNGLLLTGNNTGSGTSTFWEQGPFPPADGWAAFHPHLCYRGFAKYGKVPGRGPRPLSGAGARESLDVNCFCHPVRKFHHESPSLDESTACSVKSAVFFET